jgi:predicted Rossmann-fold nucleotide-binding protein
VLSWRQLRIHDKPIGLLNYEGYYDALLALFDSMVREGFIGPHTRALFTDAPTIEELLARMFEGQTLP